MRWIIGSRSLPLRRTGSSFGFGCGRLCHQVCLYRHLDGGDNGERSYEDHISTKDVGRFYLCKIKIRTTFFVSGSAVVVSEGMIALITQVVYARRVRIAPANEVIDLA
jgi:hypothetical protein